MWTRPVAALVLAALGTTASATGSGLPGSPWPPAPEGRVVVKFADAARVRLRGTDLVSLTGRDLAPARAVLAEFGNPAPERLFARDETAIDRTLAAAERRSGRELADLNGYYELMVAPERAAALVEALGALGVVEIAYPAPAPAPPPGEIGEPTPDFEPDQTYLGPGGVDAYEAWIHPGGRGDGVLVVDVELNWRDTHEDLAPALGQTLCFTPDPVNSKEHGTAVLGEIVGQDNGYGVTGIAPLADVGMVTTRPVDMSFSIARAIDCAAAAMEPGDVMLLEVQGAGGLPAELLQAEFDAIEAAVAQGITVVEAAGNGNQNLDAATSGFLLDQRGDSGAIIVGAGATPMSDQPDRSRLFFSSFGRPVDVQAWGHLVTTAGYGNLFDGGGDPDRYYAQGFNGTSSASAIVAGAVASLQGAQRQRGGVPYDPLVARRILIETGQPQQDGPTPGHIGPRPDLGAALADLPELYVVDVVVADDPPLGNGDGILDPGETAVLSPVVKNFGPEAATGLTGALAAPPGAVVRVIDGSSAWPDLASGGAAAPAGPDLVVTVQPDAPCGSTVRLALELATATATEIRTFDLRVGTESLEYAQSNFPTIPDGDPDGVAATLTITNSFSVVDVYAYFFNTHADAGQLVLTMESPSGTSVTLHDHGLPGTSNYSATYDRPTPVSGPGNLDDFDGEPAQGVWSLHAVDDQVTGGASAGILWSAAILRHDCAAVACAEPLPPAMGDSLRLAASGADLTASWDAQPGADAYRVVASIEPTLTDDALIGQTTSTGLVDAGALNEAEPLRFYQVRAVNACQWEGP